MTKNISEGFFVGLKFPLLHLQQFFSQHLLRKAEGYGPVKPWQPLQLTQL
jgi:hypothetical protein